VEKFRGGPGRPRQTWRSRVTGDLRQMELVMWKTWRHQLSQAVMVSACEPMRQVKSRSRSSSNHHPSQLRKSASNSV